MAYSTYTEILTLVKDWSNRRDISDERFQNFIDFAGSLANQTLRVPSMEFTTILTVSNDGHIDIPFDFLELRSLTGPFNDQDSFPLERIAWDQFINYKTDDITAQESFPQFYSRQGAYWFLTPAPIAGTQITCHYYRSLPTIDTVNQENWLSQLSPMTYVFGAMHYLYLYLMDDDRAEYWLNKYMGELARIQDIADKSEYNGSSLSVRPKMLGEV